MKIRKLSELLVLTTAFTAAITGTARAQSMEEGTTQSPAILLDRPDPRVIPLPPIKTNLPSLPAVDQLPERKGMPDVLTMNDGTKVTTIEQFKKRQKEMREILEYYHVGRMPPPPGNVKGKEMFNEVVMNGKVRYRLIHLTFGPQESLWLDVGIYTPIGVASAPVVIAPGNGAVGAAPLPPGAGPGPTSGMGVDVLLPPEIGLAEKAARDAANGITAPEGGAGGRGGRGGRGGAGGAELPFKQQVENAAQGYAQVLNRGYGIVSFATGACAEDTSKREPDGSFSFRKTRFFPAYPGYDWGIIGGWVWGTMRVVDYLQVDPLVDKAKIIITGASRVGKAAMISGAFDDRIAMVAPVASSGLGTPAYRFSGGATQTQPSRGGKEGLTLMVMKYGHQFSPHLRQFWGQVDKLPYDAHWFPALAAPRPFIMLEGTKDHNVAHNGIKQTYLAAIPAYELFTAWDSLGVYWSDRPHGFGANDWEGLLGFADKHLLKKNVLLAFDTFPATNRTDGKGVK